MYKLKEKRLRDNTHVQLVREGMKFITVQFTEDWMGKKILNVEEYSALGVKSLREIQQRRRATNALALGHFDSLN